MNKISDFSSERGWALVTVVLFTLLILALSAGLLSWSTTEMRIDVSHKRRLVSQNMAESLIAYGAAQAALKVQQVTDFDLTLLNPATPASALQIPPASFFAGSNIDPDRVEIIGKVSAPPVAGRFDVLASNPSNAYSSLRGRSGRDGHLTILARATTFPDFLGRRESIYLKRTLTVLDEPVLQYAAFYNMDFEVAPGPDLNIYGPVHTNGDMWVSQQTTGGHLRFWENVTAVGVFRKGYKVKPVKADGGREASGNGNIEFITPTKTFENLYGDWSTWTNRWRDQYMGESTASDAAKDAFKAFTIAKYSDESHPASLQSGANGVTKRPLPGQLDNYVPDPDPTDGKIDSTFRNVPRALIERPLLSSDVEYVGPEVEKQKMSRKAGLYIIVNASGATVATVSTPSGTIIPGGLGVNEYRAYVRDPDSSRAAPTYSEVKLPGQPQFGANPGHAAPVDATRPPRPVIIVKPRQMVDMRRYIEKDSATPNGFNYFDVNGRSTSNYYQPKIINIIEVDMTALKKAVEKTVNSATTTMIFPYDIEAPAADSSIVPYNTAPYSSLVGTPRGNYQPQKAIFYSTYRAKSSEFGKNGTKIGKPTLTADDIIEGMASKHWDGSVYIESLEADYLRTADTVNPAPTPAGSYPTRRAHGHRKSGVRLINGRGPVVSAGSARLADTTHPCSPGLTLSTNDALYILGHFNADGTIYSTTSNPTDAQLDDINTTDVAGSNSSLFKDPKIISGGPDEQPVALVGDAITILSQPTYDSSGLQTAGWSDELSYLTMSTGTDYNAQWMVKEPSSTNAKDGASPTVSGAAAVNTDTPFDPLPSLSDDPRDWKNVHTFRNEKWPGAPTEIAAGFIVGLTPSAKHPTDTAKDGNNSGGLHNLPRFLEEWDGICAIRGSMVVMFESQVAWEPWSIRVYSPPTRLWGYNNMFRNFSFSDDIPATRNVGVASGDSFQRINRAQYIDERRALWPTYTFPPVP